MMDWSREEFLSYARANLKKREFRQRMKQANYGDKWDENDLANLLCLDVTGHGLEPASPELDKAPEPEPIKEEIPYLPRPFPKRIPDISPNGEDDEEVERLFEEYVQRYDMPEPNDKFMIRQLCRFQVAMDKANRNYMKLLDTRESQTQLKAAADQLDKLTLRVSTLQRDLGIDKAGRGAEADSGEKLMEYARQARHILHREGFPLLCVNCIRGEDKVFNLFGFCIWHFASDADWEFTFTCPRCHQKMTYNNANISDLKRLAGWDR